MRPFQISARSAASVASRCSKAPFSWHSRSTSAYSCSTSTGGAVELDDEHRAGAVGVVAVHGRLGRLDRERVHHLDRGRHDAGGDDRGGGGAGLVGALEADEQRAHLLGQPDQPHGRGGDDAEGALGADDRAEQVVAGAVRGRAAEARRRRPRR